MRARLMVGVMATLAATALATGQAREAPDVRLGIAGRSNATPTVAARGDLVAVAWSATVEGKSDVYVAVSRNGGRRFGPPVQANDQPGEVRSGGEMPPRVVLVPSADPARDPGIVVVWRARTPTTSIRYARSDDGGRSFAPARTVQSPEALGERGWQAATVGPDGRVHTVWLDHRGMASAAGGGATAHAGHRQAAAGGPSIDGAAMAQRSSLYYTALDESGPHERELTTGVCYCCKTALAAGRDGAVYAAWRHVYPGNLRDIAFTASSDGGRTFTAPTRVSEDRWALAGCPDDGPSMAVDAAGTVHLVWPTVIGGDEPQGAIFYATSRDGRTFTARRRVPALGSPKPSHPQIAVLADGRVLVAWDEVQDGTRVAALTTLPAGAAGETSFTPPIVLDPSGGAAVYPVLAASGEQAIAVWTSGPVETSTIAIRRLTSGTVSGSR